jgi:hypothetical protein
MKPPHDNACKQIFSHAKMVEDLLRGFVNEDWVGALDYTTLEKVNGSYVAEDLKDRSGRTYGGRGLATRRQHLRGNGATGKQPGSGRSTPHHPAIA